MKRERRNREQKNSITGKHRKRRYAAIAGVVLFLLAACDMRLKTVYYTIDTGKLNRPVRLALITDLHSCKYGAGQDTLLRAIDARQPDIVLLGGDIFDDERPYENAKITLQYLAQRYPCYYVTGNHEYWSKDITTILNIVASYGITILEGECETIQIDGQTIHICGVDDPDAVTYTKNAKGMTDQLAAAQAQADKEGCTILLSHRPEWVRTYEQYSFDVILTGHAHGGQWRIPGILNGLYAPNQGIAPKYAGGEYPLEHGTMIVSRGLARESTLAPRIFNRPELVIVDLQ